MKLGDKDMDELSKVLRDDQRKEDELEKLIREMKKQSKKFSFYIPQFSF